MNIKKAAEHMERLIIKRWPEMDTLPLQDYEIGINHLQYMCQRIYNGSVSGQKAAIWLGYVQGVVRSAGGATLEELGVALIGDEQAGPASQSSQKNKHQ